MITGIRTSTQKCFKSTLSNFSLGRIIIASYFENGGRFILMTNSLYHLRFHKFIYWVFKISRVGFSKEAFELRLDYSLNSWYIKKSFGKSFPVLKLKMTQIKVWMQLNYSFKNENRWGQFGMVFSIRKTVYNTFSHFFFASATTFKMGWISHTGTFYKNKVSFKLLFFYKIYFCRFFWIGKPGHLLWNASTHGDFMHF